jgi:membrane associated rhomboid family serine protease
MFFPISDSPNPKGIPWATWTIIALNVIAFLVINLPLGSQPADVTDPAYPEYMQFLSQYVGSPEELAQAAQQVSNYDLFVFKHGYRPAEGSVMDLVFSMFLHGGLMHLFGNMLFLFIYGNNVENRLGSVWFVVWYLLTGAAATLFHAAFFSSSDVPLVGASGAISGVLGFYFIWFPKNAVRVLVFLPPFFARTFEIAARIVLAVYLFLDNVVPFIFAGGGGVAHGAHIGGFLAGAAAALVMNWRSVAGRPKDIRPPKVAPVSRGAFREALSLGNFEEAASDYFALPSAAARTALSPDEAVSLANRLRGNGQSDAALVMLQRVIRDAPKTRDIAEVYALAGFILLDDMDNAPAAYQYLVAASQLGATPATQAEIRRSLAAIENRQKLHVGPVRPPGRPNRPWSG